MGNNPNAKKLRENDKKNADAGPRSICADPDAFKHSEPKSKLHHSGKRK